MDYGYDAVGNIKYKSDYSTNSTSAYQYQANSNKINSIALKGGGSVSFGYDNKGNLTTRNGSTEIAYNVFNKPVQINKNGSVSLSYGADLSRVKQVRTTGGTTTTTWYIDKHYEVEKTGSGSTTQVAYISDVAIVKLSDVDKTIRFTHRDRLGSATTLTDHNGQVVARRHFDAFGAPRGGDWSEQSLVRLPDSETRRGFTGHEHLDEAELIHMNGRVYDYKVGRFLSVDPLIHGNGNSQGINPYSYILNNPLSGTDPTGYAPCPPTTGTRICRLETSMELKDGKLSVHMTGGTKAQQQKVKDGIVNGQIDRNGNGGSSLSGGSGMVDFMGQGELGVQVREPGGGDKSPNKTLISSLDESLERQELDLSDSEVFRQIEHFEYQKHYDDGTAVILFRSSGEWKDTMLDDIVSALVGFSTGITKVPTLTAGVSMPVGFQKRSLLWSKVPIWERYDQTSVYSRSKSDPKDVKLIGRYSEKLNYEYYENVRKAVPHRTDYQLRYCNGNGCSKPSTFYWSYE